MNIEKPRGQFMWIMHKADGPLKVKPFTVLPTCIFVQWSESYPQVARLQKHSLSCSLYNLALVPLSHIDLTHCGVVPPHGVREICIGNGLLLGGIKPLAEPMLTNHQWGCLLAFTWEQLHREYWSYSNSNSNSNSRTRTNLFHLKNMEQCNTTSFI